MTSATQPLVSVVTPVYNGADFIAACIESVLKQTYSNYEYIIINNCSKDRTLEIAQSYAQRYPRIRVHDNTEFLGVIANHNHAFRLISPDSKYCKVVSADDWIFPSCLTEMVAFGEANPSVGMIGCYLLAGKQVMNAGLEYERSVVGGRKICHDTLLGGPYVFGSPTSLLYRNELLREYHDFYPNPNPHADTSACFRSLQKWDFGFVHQVLSYAQIHSESQTSRSIKYGTIRRALIADVARYGPLYLSPEELQARLDHLMRYYYRWLVGAIITNRGDEKFWPTQKAELEDVGIKLSNGKIAKAVLQRGVETLLSPRHAVERIVTIGGKDPRKIEAQYY